VGESSSQRSQLNRCTSLSAMHPSFCVRATAVCLGLPWISFFFFTHWMDQEESDQAPPSGRLFVGGLPPDITSAALSNLLEAFGVQVACVEFNAKNAAMLGTSCGARRHFCVLSCWHTRSCPYFCFCLMTFLAHLSF